MRLRQVPAGVLAFFLWLATAVVGLWAIVVIREMLFRIYARFADPRGRYGYDYWAGLSLGNWAVLILSILWLALVVGGGEYHRTKVGQRSSWRVFGWTIAVEVAILILALFV